MILCKRCPNEIERVCHKCGGYFCDRHVTYFRYVKWVQFGRGSIATLDKQCFCDDCRPNQTVVLTEFYLFWTFAVAIHVLVVAYLVYQFRS